MNLDFDYFTDLQLEREHGFRAILDSIYKDVVPGGKDLDQFTRREIVLARIAGDTSMLREIEERNIQLSDGELDDNYHEVKAVTH